MPGKRIAPSEQVCHRLEDFLPGSIGQDESPTSTLLNLVARGVRQEALEAEQQE